MEPIINPWLIYAVNICGSLKEVAKIITILITLPISIIGMNITMEVNEKDKKFYIRIEKYLIGAFVVLLFLSVAIPTKETCLAMLAAYYITPDNIQVVQGNIVDFVEQLSNAVKGIKP